MICIYFATSHQRYCEEWLDHQPWRPPTYGLCTILDTCQLSSLCSQVMGINGRSPHEVSHLHYGVPFSVPHGELVDSGPYTWPALNTHIVIKPFLSVLNLGNSRTFLGAFRLETPVPVYIRPQKLFLLAGTGAFKPPSTGALVLPQALSLLLLSSEKLEQTP